MAVFQNDEQRAIAYAAFLNLKRMLDDDGELPAGFAMDCSNCKVEITLPQGTIVERATGTNGDGSYYKKAIQNLYGYALIALLIVRLKKFKQWNAIKPIVIDTMKEVVRRSNKKFRDEIIKEHPDVKAEIELLEAQLEIPERLERTPRICKETGDYPTITFRASRRSSVKV